MLKVIVASNNPVKIEAATLAFEEIFHAKILAIGHAVASGVSEQPLSYEETLLGAVNRVRACIIAKPNADYWVGIEGGVEAVGKEFEAFGCIAVADADRIFTAKSATFPLPPIVSQRLFNGEELGPINDDLFKQHNTKVKGGAIGLLTNGVISRTNLYKQPIIMACIPFVNKRLYKPVPLGTSKDSD